MIRGIKNLDNTFKKYKENLKGKKLLILGGASQHCKLVDAAHELGVIVYITDNLLDHAPAKEIADFAYNINVTETEELAQICEREGINGIASGWLDFVQTHYQKLCERMNLHCYGTREQFEILTKKSLFKEYCIAHKVGVPTIISLEDIEKFNEILPFSIFVKPSHSAGSKGSTVCTTKTVLLEAIEKAKEATNDGRVIIERYIEKGDMFLVVYFFHNGKAYVQQLSDAYFGNKEDGLDKINVAYCSPFSKAERYMEVANDRFVAMLKSIGVENGPVCMQGFMTNENALFYDPGRRFPGGEYERIVKRYTGVDMMKGMVVFALTGNWPEEAIPVGEKPYLLGGKISIRLQINVCSGIVKKEIGFDEARNFPEVEYIAVYHYPGDTIEATGNTHQRYAHVVIGANTRGELIRNVERLYNTIDVLDVDGNSMLMSKFDVNKLRTAERA
jgi:biotin carboxylase